MNEVKLTSDDMIIDLYLKRDEQAIRHTKEKYQKRILFLAEDYLKDHESALECENDVYLKTWNLIPPNEPRDHFFAFLAKITRHLSIDRIRKDQARKRAGELISLSEELSQILPDRQSDIEDMLMTEELMQYVNSFVKSLPQEKRILFVRRYFYTDSIKDLAEHMHVSESKIKTTLYRTRQDLKAYLQKEGYAL